MPSLRESHRRFLGGGSTGSIDRRHFGIVRREAVQPSGAECFGVSAGPFQPSFQESVLGVGGELQRDRFSGPRSGQKLSRHLHAAAHRCHAGIVRFRKFHRFRAQRVAHGGQCQQNSHASCRHDNAPGDSDSNLICHISHSNDWDGLRPPSTHNHSACRAPSTGGKTKPVESE